jgi:hypothetical protein
MFGYLPWRGGRLTGFREETYSTVVLPEIAGREKGEASHEDPDGLGWILAALVGGAVSVNAQTEHLEATVLDGAGGAAAGGDYQLVAATAQPGGIQTATAGGVGGLRNYAGFLGTFALRRDLDHDGNSLPDEWDDDNDGDGLEDGAELDGRDFAAAWGVAAPTDLNAPDSDGDGAATATNCRPAPIRTTRTACSPSRTSSGEGRARA